MIKRVLAAGILCLFSATVVVSAAGMEEARVADMKKNGGAMGALGAIAKGEKPYDAETVKAALTSIATVIKGFPAHFGPGTEQDSKGASPKIWANMDDFKAKADKLGADAEAILAQLPADQAAVGAAVAALGKDCGSCHELYRIKKD
ncbi:cytochrome c [Rhizobium sp. KVB221]|uniref:Cytochrome c n=1 Tax=Rhizobium setariae TaxID=2801340 RepID=A0A937CMK6_9HYPH|nr:cytochrome c [Rhizobium setariae]MBL0374435.1 cytochrome c [Rhizobium setariae]